MLPAPQKCRVPGDVDIDLGNAGGHQACEKLVSESVRRVRMSQKSAKCFEIARLGSLEQRQHRQNARARGLSWVPIKSEE